MRVPLMGNPKDEVFEIRKMPCERASLSIGAFLGNVEEVPLPGLLREMNSMSGFLSRTRRSLRFEV